MPTSTRSRLLRLLLSLAHVFRFPLSAGRVIVLALRGRFASLWRSILKSTSRRNQSRICLCSNDVPVASNDTTGAPPQIPQGAGPEDGHGGTPAAIPSACSRHANRWQDELRRHQELPSRRPLVPLAATPERASQRYTTKHTSTIVHDADTQLKIPAGQERLLSALPSLPDQWSRHVHPEGVVLYYHKGLHIFTESNVYDLDREKDLRVCAKNLFERAIKTNGVSLDDCTEIVINVDERKQWYYYFVDHTNRLLFWVDSVYARDLDTDLQGVTEYNHIKYKVEAHYWYTFPAGVPGTDIESSGSYLTPEPRSHCEYYPHNRSLSKRAFDDLRGMLNYAKTDMMTTDSSSSPFAQDELVAMLDLVNSLRDDDDEISDSCSIWVIARLMAFFTENQFLNFCGQPCARLNADTPLFGEQTWNRSKVFKAFNLFLFGAPSEHAVRLQRVWVDGIIIQPRWKDFMNRLKDELGRYTIFSTVMLAVAFSFLAVPGVVDANKPASPIEILIYCSIVSTTASIVFSFVLLNLYSNPGLTVARHAVNALSILSQGRSGMACLAITHSLPLASLIWSIVLFAVALAVQIFRPGQRGTVVTLSVECAIIVFFVIMGIWVMRLFWEDPADDADDADDVVDVVDVDNVYDVDDAAEKKLQAQVVSTSPQGSQRDVERGLGG